MTAEEETAVKYLPERLCHAVRRMAGAVSGGISEIRLRRGGPLSLTSDGENIPCGVLCTDVELEFTVGRLCRNSLYSQADSICEGCITTEHGIRAGVCGRAVLSDGRISCVRDISSICIRIPHRVIGAAEPLRAAVESGQSVLIYSPPGLGKTTVLRELLHMISTEYKRRCAVIDTRFELAPVVDGGGYGDVFSGYPRFEGIMSAVRTMSPEYIICDEVSDMNDARALIYARSSGVAVCASAHAASASGLRRSEVISGMLGGGVFDYLCGIRRVGSSRELTVEEVYA